MFNKMFKASYEFMNNDDIILRDYLALERTRLANERTLLSFIRTSLYMLLGGIAFLQVHGFDSIKWIGYFSLAISFAIMVIGLLRFYQLKNRLMKYYSKNYKKTE